MCLNVKKIIKEGIYKETTYKGFAGEKYSVEAWQKCGYCQECQNEKKINWIVRNVYESRAHKDICFLTLTYAKNPYVLIKKDLQDFFKRLRKHLFVSVRYFARGEYGVLRSRPHFHLILYGWKDPSPQYVGINKKGNLLFNSPFIEKIWGKGLISYQNFDMKEIPYLVKYQLDDDVNRQVISDEREKISVLREKVKNEEEIFEKKRHKKLISFERLFQIYSKNHTELERLQLRFEKNRSKYFEVKPFNLWSTSLGWQEFVNDYNNIKSTMKFYFDQFEYLIPSSYLKKMANLGDFHAIRELERRRDFEIDRFESVEKRKVLKNEIRQFLDFNEKLYWQKYGKNITIL